MSGAESGGGDPDKARDADMVIRYLEYARDDVRVLSPMAAHLLDLAIQQIRVDALPLPDSQREDSNH